MQPHDKPVSFCLKKANRRCLDVEGPFRQYLYAQSFTDEFLAPRSPAATGH
jgi:hypothetical protein